MWHRDQVWNVYLAKVVAFMMPFGRQKERKWRRVLSDSISIWRPFPFPFSATRNRPLGKYKSFIVSNSSSSYFQFNCRSNCCCIICRCCTFHWIAGTEENYYFHIDCALATTPVSCLVQWQLKRQTPRESVPSLMLSGFRSLKSIFSSPSPSSTEAVFN